MTKSRYRKLKPIMDAWVEGKDIEYKNSDTNGWTQFTDVFDIGWLACSEYRIKPETKYRPFKTVEEVEKVFGKTINGYDCSFIITGAMIRNGSLYVLYGTYTKTALEMFDSVTFTDGSPCGICE